MKTSRFFGAALFAVALTFGFTSCNKDDAPIEGVSDLPTCVDELLGKSSKVELDKPSIEPMVISVMGHPAFDKILLDSHEKAVLMASTLTKAIVDGSNVFEATYYVDPVPALLTIDSDDFGLMSIDLSTMTELMIGGVSYPITVLTIPPTANPNEVDICRTWYSPNYTAGVYFDHVAIYGVSSEDKAGVADIKDLAANVLDRLKSKNSDSFDPEDVQILSSDISSLTFTTEKLYVCYTNGKVEQSDWAWTNKDKGILKTVIDNKEVVVHVRFEKGIPNKAYFLIDGNIDVIGNLGKHHVTGQLICIMQDAMPK